MTNREKIIVGLAVVALAYGAYVLFLAKPATQTFQSSTKKGLDSLNSFITKVAEAANQGLSEKDSYILQRAEMQWVQDPLINIRRPTQAETEPEPTMQPVGLQSQIMYTGYLEMGNTRLAIINGNEYEIGELVEPGGYVLRSISPTQVVIATTDQSKNQIIIPLQETQ